MRSTSSGRHDPPYFGGCQSLTMDPVGDGGQALCEVDLRHLTVEKRGELSALLDQYEVQHEAVGSDLLVPAAETELVEDLLGLVDGSTPAGPMPAPEGRDAPSPPLPMVAAVAPRWRRFVAWLLEGYLFGGLALAAAWLFGSAAGAATGLGLSVANGVVLVGWRGRTIGMFVFGMQINAPPARRQPAWSDAWLRWFIASWPGTTAVLVAPFAGRAVETVLLVIGPLWLIVCFAPILWDRFGRGLHDRAAGTVVLMADYSGPLIDPADAEDE